jgi:hypothetical protein
MRAKYFAYEDLEKRIGDQVDALQSQTAAKDNEIEGFQIEFRNIMQGEICKGPWAARRRRRRAT